jgi:long-chain acyl-CoA synthetase
VLGPPAPGWIAADFATICVGGVTVGIYPTLRPEAVRWQLEHAEARVVVVADGDTAAALVDPPCPVLRWDAELPPGDPDELRARAAAVRPEDPCAIFYTSGTTGDPKGVVVTHAAMVATCEASRDALPLRPGDRSIVYLPLAHSLQRMTVFRALFEDLEAYVCAAVTEVRDVLPVAKPSVLVAVPRVLEKILSGAANEADARGAGRVFAFAAAVARARSRVREAGARPSVGLRLRAALADALVWRSIRARLGGELRVVVVGGARLDPEVGRFFHGIGLEVCEGWGLTETCAPATVNRPGALRFGSVGPPLPGVVLRLDDDGEVLVRGPTLFQGYWRDPAATAAAFTPDGFFRTGDIGRLEGNHLRIVDRKKEILVTSGGKNIPPVNIEQRLEGGPVAQAVVFGDERPYLVALLAPDSDVAARLGPDGLRAACAARVAAANRELSSFEQVKRWHVLPGPLTVEDGLLTPTLKLRRKLIQARWCAEIDAMYGAGRE